MLHCPTCGKAYAANMEACPDDGTPLQADTTIIGDAAAADPLVGRTLDDKYWLEERLGVGGMGTVYRARHLLIDRPVAVKVLNRRFVGDEAAQIRFRREARAAGRLEHVNAVTVTDFGQTSDGYVYIVMELLQGRTLREMLAKEGPLDSARAVSLMLQASAAVAAAHDAGIIHRDLKPANIFIVQRSELPAVVKVLDFGIAKLAADSLEEEDPKLTLVGALIGTPRYMAPEQCDGEMELTPAADVYSLGVILYEMLTGAVPFSGTSPLSIAIKHASESPRKPREIAASIPPALERVVLHALEKRPQDRPANAAKFRQELYETAERLGLEHAAITSGPNIDSLRSIGTESPSGRLIIDISRLRESRAASSGDTTVLGEQKAAPRASQDQIDSSEKSSKKQAFPRMSVSLERARRAHAVPISLFVGAAILVLGIVIFTKRSTDPAYPANVNASASPSPAATASPSSSPVLPAKRDERKPENTNSNNAAKKKKKESKLGSLLQKAGRILKSPFKH